MSRTTVHAMMESFANETLTSDAKDLYLNRTKVDLFGELSPWGASHLLTNEAAYDINATAKVSGTQTEYAFPSTTASADEIKRLVVKYSASGSLRTARRVQPFELGDSEAEDSAYNDQERPVWFVRAGKIVVYPMHDSAVTSGIRVYIDNILTELSATATSTALSAPGEELWALLALECMYEAQNDTDRALVMRARYEKKKWALKKLAPVVGRYQGNG